MIQPKELYRKLAALLTNIERGKPNLFAQKKTAE
jgi:hypothetical protein